MALSASKTPFTIFKASVLLCTFFTLLAWLLLLGGVSSLEDICEGNCRVVLGLPWFIIWFQFILILPIFFVEFMDTYSAWRPTLNLLLSINTVLAILMTDRFLDRRNGSSRVNATVAGFIILSIFNLLLILLSGSRTALNARYGEDRDVGVATYPTKTRPTGPAPPAASAPQTTVGAGPGTAAV